MTSTITRYRPIETRLCLLPSFSFYNILHHLPSALFLPPHPLHLLPFAPLGPSSPCRYLALIYSSHILQLPLFANVSQHPWHLYSRKLIIDSSTQAPFYRSNCIGLVILNSFVLPQPGLPRARLQFIINVVSMPIEVTSSPSITDTLHEYSEYSFQPSLFAKISGPGLANNWIIQEQAIAMEDAPADVSLSSSMSPGRFRPLILWFYAKLMFAIPLLVPL